MIIPGLVNSSALSFGLKRFLMYDIIQEAYAFKKNKLHFYDFNLVSRFSMAFSEFIKNVLCKVSFKFPTLLSVKFKMEIMQCNTR